MTDTLHLALPYLDAAQAQKHVTHNEALRRLDQIVQLAVLDRDAAAPPASPAEGDRYLVAAGASSAWTGHDGAIAAWTDGFWLFAEPRPGWLAYVADEAALLVFDGAAWQRPVDLTELQNVGKLGVLASADATNRLLVKTTAALFSHDDVTPGSGDLRLTLNKSAAGRDVGLILQDNYSTRALLGLLGDDDLTVKVSADGASYVAALTIDKTSGQASLPQAAKFSAFTNFDNYIAADTWTKVQFNNADANDQGAFDSGINAFTAPFAGLHAFGFSFRFKANAAVPDKAIAAFYRNGSELGRGRAVSGAPVDDQTTFNLSVLAPLSAGDVIDVRVNFATHDGYVKADHSHFFGHYLP